MMSLDCIAFAFLSKVSASSAARGNITERRRVVATSSIMRAVSQSSPNVDILSFKLRRQCRTASSTQPNCDVLVNDVTKWMRSRRMLEEFSFQHRGEYVCCKIKKRLKYATTPRERGQRSKRPRLRPPGFVLHVRCSRRGRCSISSSPPTPHPLRIGSTTRRLARDARALLLYHRDSSSRQSRFLLLLQLLLSGPGAFPPI